MSSLCTVFFPKESTPDNVVTSLVDGCSVLRHLQHRHILQALGVYSNNQEPIMIMLAKTTFGTLKQFLDDIRLQGGPQSSYGKVPITCLYLCSSYRAGYFPFRNCFKQPCTYMCYKYGSTICFISTLFTFPMRKMCHNKFSCQIRYNYVNDHYKNMAMH